MTTNPRRPCNGCETWDDHPRHENIDFTGADVQGGPMHMDCCAALRDCDVCKAVLAMAYPLAGEGATGEDLRAALLELPPLQIMHAEGESPFSLRAVTAA